MRWYTLWNIRGTFGKHCSMKCCEVCKWFTCVYNLRNELITNDIWWSVKGCSTKWLRIPWNILRGTLVFRPILTLNLTEISAWNIMFHGASFNCNCLILRIIEGWFLWVGLLNKKVHFPDAKVRVISGQTSIASRKTFSTPFLWTRPLVCATKTPFSCMTFPRFSESPFPICSLSVSLRAWPAISSSHFLTQHVVSLPVWQAGMPGQARQETKAKNTT